MVSAQFNRTKCAASEAQITFNATGPQGPAGVARGAIHKLTSLALW
jgi:hypothetical protein